MTAALEIPCPECGRLLRLPDRTLLGKKARCSKCGHRFILQSPEKTRGVAAEFPKRDIHFETLDESDLDGDEKRPATMPVREPADLSDAFPLAELETEADASARIRQRQRAARRRQKIMIGVSAVAIVAASIGIYVGRSGVRPPKLPKKTGPSVASARPADDEDESDDSGRPEKASRSAEPIALTLVPEGARIIIHLRPADLWQAGSAGEEFRACLGPLGVWLENIIKTKCLLEPSQIEELLFALIPVSRDAFDLAFVVRSKGEMKRSDLIEKFDGELIDQPRQHYVGPDRAWLIFDKRTFASAPKGMVQSFVESAGGTAVTSDGIQALLASTDRKKHFTLLCELEDVRLGAKTIAPDNAQNLLEGIVDFFGDDVETLAWSLQLGDPEITSPLISEVLVRNRLSRSPPRLQEDLKKRLAQLPAQVLAMAQKSDPKKIGEKKIVGRFPIMTKIVERSTHFSNSHRLVSMQVELPERAGPNLALGTLLTWNQTTLPDFGKAPSRPSPTGTGPSNLPEKIADRLKKKITVDFRSEPLQNAVAFISEETGVKIITDGPNMKLAGVTQNEKQDFQMDDVPATSVLHRILIEQTKNKLVLIVDEDKKIATVTSVVYAEEKKLKPFPLQQAGK